VKIGGRMKNKLSRSSKRSRERSNERSSERNLNSDEKRLKFEKLDIKLV
jgi:hypothetical protein